MSPDELNTLLETIPDVRDGLTRTERIILYVLQETQRELREGLDMWEDEVVAEAQRRFEESVQRQQEAVAALAKGLADSSSQLRDQHREACQKVRRGCIQRARADAGLAAGGR